MKSSNPCLKSSNPCWKSSNPCLKSSNPCLNSSNFISFRFYVKSILLQFSGYMFEEHTMIRRAAVQCWTNLCTSSQMVTRAEGKNDLVKYSVLLCGDDDDPAIVQAASGALAMLTSQSKKICNKVFDVSINCTMLQKLSKYEVKAAQYGNFSNLPPLRLFVK